MLTINAVSPLIMQDNFEMTLHIAVFKNIKQKKVYSNFSRVPRIHTTYGKERCKNVLPIVEETAGSTRPTAVC